MSYLNNNKIGNIGAKYLGLGLYKLIKLNNLELDFNFSNIFVL